MKKSIFQEIEIPEGIEVELQGSALRVKGPEGEITRSFKLGKLDFKKEGNKIMQTNENIQRIPNKRRWPRRGKPKQGKGQRRRNDKRVIDLGMICS